MRVGTVVEIWRYPVKSMAGGKLERAPVGMGGIPGDRGWALRDERAGEIRGAKKFPALMRCTARYRTEPGEGPPPPAEITLPDGTRVMSDSAEAAERLSALLGKPVTLWPLRPATDLEHYRRRPPDQGDLMADLREMFGRLENEPMPDLTPFPQELFEYTSPLGTYFDAFPIHLLTTAWLAELSSKNPRAAFDRRRFRPNFLIEPEGGRRGLLESEWSGKEIRLGEVRMKVEMPVVRCSMTTQPVDELPQDPSVLRTIVRDSGQNVGVYATVSGAGSVRLGDVVELL